MDAMTPRSDMNLFLKSGYSERMLLLLHIQQNQLEEASGWASTAQL